MAKDAIVSIDERLFIPWDDIKPTKIHTVASREIRQIDCSPAEGSRPMTYWRETRNGWTHSCGAAYAPDMTDAERAAELNYYAAYLDDWHIDKFERQGAA